jgi:hypothetical protein
MIFAPRQKMIRGGFGGGTVLTKELLGVAMLSGWRVVLYAYLFARFAVKAVLFNFTVLLPLYILVFILVAGSFASYGIFANQDPIMETLVRITKTIGEAWNFIQSLVQPLLDCKEPLVQLYNRFWELLFSVLKRIFIAVDAVFGLNFPNPWDWAARSVSEFEDTLERLRYEEELERTIDEWERGGHARIHEYNPTAHSALLSMFRMRILKTAAERAGRNKARIQLIPAQLCQLIARTFNFIIGVLSIFSDYFLILLNALIGAFEFLTGEFNENFLFIFVQTIIIEILRQIPFTECFVSNESLESNSIVTVTEAIANQIARRLASCACALRYKNPLGIDPILSPVPGGDDVPQNTFMAWAGCLCVNPRVSVNGLSNVGEYIIKCTEIDRVIDEARSIKNELEGGIQATVTFLQNSVNFLEGRWNDLRSDVEGLITEIERVRGLIPGQRNVPSDFDTKSMNARTREARRFLNAVDFQAELTRQLFNQTYVDEMNERPGVRTAQTMASIAVHSARLFATKAEETSRQAPRTVMEVVMSRLPEEHSMRTFWAQLEERSGPERAEHVRAFHRGTDEFLRIAGPFLRGETSSEEMGRAIDAIDMESVVRAVDALNGPKERAAAPAVIRSLDVAGTLVINSLGGEHNFKLSAQRLLQTYGSTEAVASGVRAVQWALAGRPGYKDVMRMFNLTHEDVERAHGEAREELHQKMAKNKERLRLVTSIKNYAVDNYARYVDNVYHEYERHSGATMGTRVIVVGVFAVAGGLTATVTVAGFAVGAALGAVGTLLIGLVGPLLPFLILNLPYLLTVVSNIAVGVVISLLPDSPDKPRAFDFFGPFIDAVIGPITTSFFFGFQQSDIDNLVSDWSAITRDALEYLTAFTIAYATGKWPLPLGRYIKARDPLVDEDGRMDESILDYLLNAIVYCPHKRACFRDSDCGFADCVCPDNPSRLGTLRPDAPCLAEGKCRCWPFIQERIGIQTLQYDLVLDPQCDVLYGYEPEDIKIWNIQAFAENGFTLRFLLNREFWVLVYRMLIIGLGGFRFTVRRAVLGGFIKWEAVVLPLAGAMFFLPAPILQFVALLTIATNTLSGPAQETALFFIDFFERNQDAPLVGAAFSEALTWLRFPNYMLYPPFGLPANNDWICLFLNLSAFLLLLAALVLGIALLASFVLAGGVGLTLAAFADFFLIWLNLLYFIARSIIVTAILNRDDMLSTPAMRTGTRLYRYTARRRMPTEGRMITGAPLSAIGIHSTTDAIRGGGVAFLRTGASAKGAPAKVPWGTVVWRTAKGTFWSLPRWATVGWADAWRHGPLRFRPVEDADRGVTCVVFDGATPDDEIGVFPLHRYIYSHRDEPLDRFGNIVPVNEKIVGRRWDDEWAAQYSSVEPEKEKTN